MLFGYYVIILV